MEFFAPFVNVLLIALDIIQWIVLVWVVLSWIIFFTHQSQFRWRHRQFYGILEQLNEIFGRMARPFLRPFQKLLPAHKTGYIDWSPILLYLAIVLVRQLIALAAARILMR